MLKPCVPVEKFEAWGFKPCKGIPRSTKCYYLCVARGKKMIFVSPFMYSVIDWNITDPRIHKHPNCRYSDNRTAEDITFEITKADMLEYCFG